MSEYIDIAVKYGRIPGGGEEEVEDFEESDDYEDGDENDEIFRLGDPFPHIEPADIRSVEGKQDTTEGSILHRPTEHLKCNQEIPGSH